MPGLVAGVGLLVCLASSWAVAQPTASHQVAVTIPHVLRLRLDADSGDRATSDVALDIQVSGGRIHIEPAATRVEIMANSAWQLMATFVPNAVSRDLHLMATVRRSGARTTLSALPRIVSSGAATRGWTTESVSFGLASLPADGLYGGVITYALTLP